MAKTVKISLIINTCAFGPKATTITGSFTEAPHSSRCYALENFILPTYIFDPFLHEVIVVGEWKEGQGYTYIHSPSEYFGAEDALTQRQLGFEAAVGDIMIFQHDDHILHPRSTRWLYEHGLESDVLVPNRRKRYMNNDVPLNNGRAHGYIGGHCAVYTREALEAAPWGDLERIFEWDTLHTAALTMADMEITWPTFPQVYDIEVGEDIEVEI